VPWVVRKTHASDLLTTIDIRFPPVPSGNSETELSRRSSLLRNIIDGGLLTCLSLGALYAVARAELTPRDPTQGVAVVFAPWTTADETLSQAVEGGGRFVRFGALPFIAVVIPDDVKYPNRMLDAGAWLVVDPLALAACLPPVSSAAEPS
jgi:hypothetical protein